MFGRGAFALWLTLELVLGLVHASPAGARQAGTVAPAASIVERNRVVASSKPAMQRVTGAALRAPVGVVDCATIWKAGVPREGTGLTDCVEHSDERIGGADYRVLYPAEWAAESGGGWGRAYLDPAKEALRRSAEVYGKLGTMGSVTLVFTRLAGDAGDDPRANASLVEPLSDEPCSVFVYPISIGDSPAAFRQVIAHELFHCFQAFNFASVDVTNPAANGWWVDGSADYFSNVVYPKVNLEWEYIGEFDADSETRPITQFTYAASFFFQHLGNSIGDAAVIKLLGTLPVGGDEVAQQAALRAYPGMDALFHGFAQQYLDGKLMDTSGAAMPFAPTFAITATFNASDTFEATIDPFVVRRRSVVFDPTLQFTFEVKAKSGASLFAFRREGGSWGEAPTVIDCDDPHVYKAVFTSVGGGETASAPAVVTATVNASEADCEEETDDCLQGDWQVADYEAFLRAALDLAGATDSATPITFEGTSGDLWFTFDDDTITYSANEFELRGSASVQGLSVEVTVRLDGEATAGYEVVEEETIELVELDTSGFSVEAEAFVGGSSAGVTPIEPDQWIFFISPTYGYTCKESTLELMIPPLDEPVVLERQD